MSGVDFSQGTLVVLNRQWEFYWDKLLTPENFASATPLQPDFLMKFRACGPLTPARIILYAEIYTGDLVQGHTKTFDHKQIHAGANNLIPVSGTHEAIVSHELFEQV